MNRRHFLLAGAGVATMLGAAALARRALAAEPLKIGFVYVGPVGDHGWTYRHDIGRRAVEKALGNRVETSFVESVKEGPDAERVIRQMASSGYGLIFTTSFGFMNATLKVARQFPNVKFCHATGYKRAPNVSTYMARFYEGRYVAGKVAGKLTKSGIVGYIGSFPIPEVVRGVNAFTLALKTERPDARVKVVWVNSWYDPGREADAAKALVDQGADIMMQHTDSPAPLQVAENRGIWGVGQASDMRKFAPNAQITAIVDNWNGYYIDQARAVLDGSWKSTDTWGGFAAGMTQMAPYGARVPADVVALGKKVEEAIRSGKLHPFAGPAKDRGGKLRIPSGSHASDGELLGMDWFVEGVQGSLPS